jgi:hypothetical protein
MSEPILDCHHIDVTHLVNLRAVVRAERRTANYRRYVRQYQRRRG